VDSKTLYHRAIVVLVGPLAIAAGYFASKIVAKAHILASFGVGETAVASAIVFVGTYLIAAACVLIPHIMFLRNAAKWWETVVGLHKSQAISPNDARVMLGLPVAPSKDESYISVSGATVAPPGNTASNVASGSLSSPNVGTTGSKPETATKPDGGDANADGVQEPDPPSDGTEDPA
jgi:hypothetical protein